MERFLNSLDPEKFIDAIKEQPPIWDSSREDYCDRAAKKLAWDTVVSTFIADYEEKSVAERKNLCNAFSRKWKSFRDCYSREVAKKRKESLAGSAVYRKEYMYYEQLSFLGALKHTSTNDEDGECSKDNDYDPTDPDYREEPPTKRAKRNRNQREEIVSKQKVADPDRLFMLSLVPEMKKIPDYMKLEVKSKLLAVFTSALNPKNSRNQGFQMVSHGNQHRVNVPTIQVTVPVSINYDSNPMQPEIVADLNEVLNPPLCKAEPTSDVDFEESD